MMMKFNKTKKLEAHFKAIHDAVVARREKKQQVNNINQEDTEEVKQEEPKNQEKTTETPSETPTEKKILDD